MNDKNLIKGIVSARNAETGEVLFENLHNTVVVGGCLFGLAKLAGIGNNEDGSIYYGDNSQSIDAFLGAGAVTHYNFLVSEGADPSANKVSKIELASDNSWLFKEEPKELGFFSGGESYSVADIPDNDDAKKAKILYLPKEGAELTFIRFKAPLSNADIIVETGKTTGKVTYIKSIGLFLKKPSANEFALFSRIDFPSIPFFGNLTIDFEYRLYL